MSFYVMYISCMLAVEFFKNLFYYRLAHPGTMVLYFYDDMVFGHLGKNIDARCFGGVFYGIVHYIDNDVGEMHLVRHYLTAFRIEMGFDISAPIGYDKLDMGDRIVNYIVCVYPILTNIQLVFFQFRYAQYVLDLCVHPLVLVPYHRKIALHLLLVTDNFRVSYVFHRQIYGGDRCLELMGHIVYKIGFYLCYLFLSDQLINSTRIGSHYHQRKQ